MIKYRIEFVLEHKYDVAYGEYRDKKKRYLREIQLDQNVDVITVAQGKVKELMNDKNKFGFDGEIVAGELSKITRIDQEEILTAIPF